MNLSKSTVSAGALYLLRHGESTWNREDRFTGSADVPLTADGVKEMQAAGAVLRSVPLARIFSSALLRTWDSARIVRTVANQPNVTIIAAPELNERFYGDLEGLDKEETAVKYGAAQVRLWQRSYDVPPPGGESLQSAASRIIPYFEQAIVPLVLAGDTVLVCAHGNTLRAIRRVLDNLSPEAVMDLEVPTGGLYRYKPVGATKSWSGEQILPVLTLS